MLLRFDLLLHVKLPDFQPFFVFYSFASCEISSYSVFMFKPQDFPSGLGLTDKMQSACTVELNVLTYKKAGVLLPFGLKLQTLKTNQIRTVFHNILWYRG